MGRRDSFTSRPSRDYGRDYRDSYSHRRDYNKYYPSHSPPSYREHRDRRKHKEDYYHRRSRSRSRSFSPRHYHRYKSQQISDSNEYRTGSSNTASNTPNTIAISPQRIVFTQNNSFGDFNFGDCNKPCYTAPPCQNTLNLKGQKLFNELNNSPQTESPVKRPRIESNSRTSSQYHRSSPPPRLLLCKRPTLPSVQLDPQLYPHPWPADFEEELQTLYHDLRNCQNEELNIVKSQTQLKYELDCQHLEILKLEGCVDTLNGLDI